MLMPKRIGDRVDPGIVINKIPKGVVFLDSADLASAAPSTMYDVSPE